MNKEQMTQEQRAQLIEKLRAEYNELNGKIARLNAFLCDIDFVNKVPDPMEQELMSMQFRSMKVYLDNLRGRIMFQEAHQLMEENARKQLDEWKKMKGKVVNTLCGPVHLINTDEQHHCGQDASCQVGDGVAVVKSAEHLKPYLGWEVISVGDMPCDGCPAEHYGAQCVKLELIDRSYICLAPQPNSIITE